MEYFRAIAPMNGTFQDIKIVLTAIIIESLGDKKKIRKENEKQQHNNNIKITLSQLNDASIYQEPISFSDSTANNNTVMGACISENHS